MVYVAIREVGQLWEIIGIFTDLAAAEARVLDSQGDTNPNDVKHRVEVWEFTSWSPAEVLPITL